MGSSKKQTVGYRYYLGLHFGICHGPVDSFQEVRAGDRIAWMGSITGNSSAGIEAPDLFGGEKKEGGISGTLDVLMGGAAQTANDYLVSKIGAGIPAFRGILSAVWRGGQVSANNPYVKPWSFRVQRILAGWTGGTPWQAELAPIDVASDLALFPFNETFADGLAPYTFGGFVPGRDSFTIEGEALRIAHIQNAGIANAHRSIPAKKYTSFSASFTINTEGNSTAGYLVVFGGSGDSVTFVPQNDTSFDATRRASLQINGGGIVMLSKLVQGAEYRFSFTIAGSSLNWQLERMAVGVVHAGSATCAGNFTGLTFVSDNDAIVLGNVTTWDNILTVYSEGSLVKDMNPAHIVYECLTNTSWGMGYPTSAIDEASFLQAAQTLFDETFGLSMIWNRQDTLESFIKVVLDHAGGILYVRPDTGRFALKLIRGGYDVGTLPLFDPSNLISATNYQRQAWGETVNEVTVVFREWKTNKDGAVTLQDLANIQTQGGVVSQVRQYPGISNAALAQRLALRDLNTVSTPIAKVQLQANRAAWQLIPGDVFRWSWPAFGVEEVVLRVLEVNRGTLQNGTISIEAVEDVFALPGNTYAGTQPGEWVDPSSDPAPAPARKLLEAPYWDLNRTLSPSDLDYVDDLAGYVQTLASRPSGDAVNYEIQARVGTAAYEERGAAEFAPSALLVGAITKTSTVITFDNAQLLDIVSAGGYAVIGDEYVALKSIDRAAGTAVIARGVLDTVPADHADNALIWFADGFLGADQTEYASAEVVSVKILPRTGRGELQPGLAPVDAITIVRRQIRPYPPGNFKINTLNYPALIAGEDVITLSWSHRDRLTQTAYLVEQNEGNIGPEAGTNYTAMLWDTDTDTVVEQFTGISGTSQVFSALTGLLNLRADVWSVRDGLASYQIQSHAFVFDNLSAITTEDGDTITTEADDRIVME